jgi:hypothetical protein
VDELVQGATSYFDFAFQPKVLVRARAGREFVAGAHAVRGGTAAEELPRHPDLVAAHLPFLTLSRLERRAEVGRALIDEGAPWDFSWQSQLVATVERQGRLFEFWRRHAVAGDGTLAGLAVDVDERFAAALQPTLRRLTEAWGGVIPLDTEISFVRTDAESVVTAAVELVSRYAAQGAESERVKRELASTREQLEEVEASLAALSATWRSWFRRLLARLLLSRREKFSATKEQRRGDVR